MSLATPGDNGHAAAHNPYGTGHLPPLRLTTARWLNRKRATRALDGSPSEKWSKVLAHRGPLTQFAYGSDTPSDWNRSGLQMCIIAAQHTGVIIIDVDDWARFAVTPLARALIARGLPASHRGPGHCHYILDARLVPPERWPSMAALYGDKNIGHCKSAGWVPLPGSEHFSGARYEPVLNAGGRTDVSTVDKEILCLLEQAVSFPQAGGGHGGSGGGHDGEIAARVLGWVRQAVNAGADPADPEVKDWIYRQWRQLAVPRDPAWPYEREDFERHYKTAAAKAKEPAPAGTPGRKRCTGPGTSMRRTEFPQVSEFVHPTP